MTTVVGIGDVAVTLETRHLPIEDGDILILTLPEDYGINELDFAKRTCQQLRDELASAGKTVTTVILPQQISLATASRATIQELYGRLGLSLLPKEITEFDPDQYRQHRDQEPNVWLSDNTKHEPERRTQKRKPAMERRKKPR